MKSKNFAHEYFGLLNFGQKLSFLTKKISVAIGTAYLFKNVLMNKPICRTHNLGQNNGYNVQKSARNINWPKSLAINALKKLPNS